jgi:hypothetical protein
MMKLHACVDCTLQPSGKLIMSSFVGTHLLSTLMPPIIKNVINVTPMYDIDSCVAIVIAFNAFCVGAQNRWHAAAAREGAQWAGKGATHKKWCRNLMLQQYRHP